MKKLKARQFALTYCLFCSFIWLSACGDSDKTAGGVTDIDNSIATDTTVAWGTVYDEAGNVKKFARVVAYIDNQVAIVDSTETFADSTGSYKLVLKKEQAVNILYAEQDSLCVLLGEFDQHQDLYIAGKKSLSGTISGMNSGYARIAGTNMQAKINSDGSFMFNAMPPGKQIDLIYVQGDFAKGSFRFSTEDDRKFIELPPFEPNNGPNGFAPSEDFYKRDPNGAMEPHGSPYGISFDDRHQEPPPNKDFSYRELHIDGSENVYDNDSTRSSDIQYVDGINGQAISPRPGQFIDLGNFDPTSGDFTLSLWTKWRGPNGNHQVLFSQRSYWSDSTSKFQWHFESLSGQFTVMKSMPEKPEAIFFGDSTIVPKDKWTFLTLVSKDFQISMYVNGEQVGKTQTFVPNKLKEPVPFRIGGNEIDTETWNGIIDEVLVENVARSEAWIKARYEQKY